VHELLQSTGVIGKFCRHKTELILQRVRRRKASVSQTGRIWENHAKKWGCIMNRDIGKILKDSGFTVDSQWRWHFGMTWVIVGHAPTEQEKEWCCKLCITVAQLYFLLYSQVHPILRWFRKLKHFLLDAIMLTTDDSILMPTVNLDAWPICAPFPLVGFTSKVETVIQHKLIRIRAASTRLKLHPFVIFAFWRPLRRRLLYAILEENPRTLSDR